MKNQNNIIVSEGIPFILTAFLITVTVAILLFYYAPKIAVYVTIIFLALSFFIAAFFRNPNRIIPADPKAIVSPADGRVIDIREVYENDFLKEDVIKISVFMSIFNVHVNRVPMDGKAVKISYFPGKFFVASLDKASSENEQNRIVIESDNGTRIIVVQIAGIVARRIVSYVNEGDVLKKGLRFGLIRFGSRLDLYLPKGTEVSVSVGDKVKGGESIMGVLP